MLKDSAIVGTAIGVGLISGVQSSLAGASFWGQKTETHFGRRVI